ncbi:hypothetical protein [Rhodoferax sp.]|nr:hypothetical protein [Rhodoferax sp.]MDR3371953.1 hypothetical protein [Rhodoferax sp.]
MKIFLEADLDKGNGALRWEGVTNRRLRRMIFSVISVVGAVAFVAIHRM